MDPSLAHLLAMLREPPTVPSETIPEVLGELERFRSALLVSMIRGAVSERSHSSSHALDPQNHLITVREAAALLGFKPPYLYELIRRRQFPAIRSGKYVRIGVRDLHEWVQHHREERVDAKIHRGLGSPPTMSERGARPRGRTSR